MILREWRARASKTKAEAYPLHCATSVLPALKRLDGFLGADLARREADETIEFVALTRWRSLDAIRAFAGADIETAIVEPAAAAALIDFDARVRHYEVVEAA